MKKSNKKSMSRKPMMKSGGAKRPMRKYQDEGEVLPPMPGSPTPTTVTPTTVTPTPPPKRTFADAYKDNIAAGLRSGAAKRAAMKETGMRKGVDINTLLNTVGNVANSAGNVATSVIDARSRANQAANPSGGYPSAGGSGGFPPYKKGGSVMRGSQLRRQASVNGLRTSRKHK